MDGGGTVPKSSQPSDKVIVQKCDMIYIIISEGQNMTDVEMKKESYDILVVDDEEDILDILEKTLTKTDGFDCRVTTAIDGEKARLLIEENDFDLVLADHKMPGLTGIDLLTELKKSNPETVRILITGYSELGIARDAINRAEVHHYIEKPWDKDDLLSIVESALQRKKERENRDILKIENVKKAFETLRGMKNSFKSISSEHPGIVSLPTSEDRKHRVVFEFPSSAEFNKFSYELKESEDMNAEIEDVQVFGTDYIVTVSINP